MPRNRSPQFDASESRSLSPKAGFARNPEDVRRTYSPSICGGDGLQVRRTKMRTVRSSYEGRNYVAQWLCD